LSTYLAFGLVGGLSFIIGYMIGDMRRDEWWVNILRKEGWIAEEDDEAEQYDE
jgi:hypothetical protein